MFARATTALSGSGLDAGNVNVPRPNDLLYEGCAQRAADALRASYPRFSASERIAKPEAYRSAQHARRAALESLLWVDLNQEALDPMLDLIELICQEDCWGISFEKFDDPMYPRIDAQAAETGVLIAWTLRKHGAKIGEAASGFSARMLCEVRRRLFAPILNGGDYDFLRGEGATPALILTDIAVACMLMEKTPSRRLPPLKLILHTLDRLCMTKRCAPCALACRLSDVCALADFARIVKRLTRGEVDFTRETPPADWLDDVLIPWIGRDYFFDPAGWGMTPNVSGMDYFRLGYFTRDRAIAALGAALLREHDRPADAVTGRILSMELVRAARDEVSPPPRLRRAAMEDGSFLLSRVGGMTCAVTQGSDRANAGDVVLFSDASPILIDAANLSDHSLPVINGARPLRRPRGSVPMDCDFKEDHDLMSADLSMCYPDACAVRAYQRTLMTMRGDQTVRLIDAFEFAAPPAQLMFRFITAQKPLILRDCVRLGPVVMTWDGDLTAEVRDLEHDPEFPAKCCQLQFTAQRPSMRSIFSFTFEKRL